MFFALRQIFFGVFKRVVFLLKARDTPISRPRTTKKTHCSNFSAVASNTSIGKPSSPAAACAISMTFIAQPANSSKRTNSLKNPKTPAPAPAPPTSPRPEWPAPPPSPSPRWNYSSASTAPKPATSPSNSSPPAASTSAAASPLESSINSNKIRYRVSTEKLH